MSFTRGPWKILRRGPKAGGKPMDIVDSNGWSVFDSKNANGLCINAHVIATAPEMLEALEYAVAQLDTEDLDKAMQLSLDAWVVSTRGLIAKARGEE